jgi:branched-chain amino acid transport system ATP-binding protein
VALLTLTDVHASYGTIDALKSISLEVEQGAVVALLGSNGAGKSTTLRSIVGLTPARSGSIVFDGSDITELPPEAASRSRPRAGVCSRE